jgi:hypothetical protein
MFHSADLSTSNSTLLTIILFMEDPVASKEVAENEKLKELSQYSPSATKNLYS